MILVGFLYYRITVIKLPGGGELDLTSQETKESNTKTKEKAQAKGVPKDRIPALQREALLNLQAEKNARGEVELSSADIDRNAAETVDVLS